MDRAALLHHLKQQGFNERIVKAFATVKRERFVPAELKAHAYDDIALSLGIGSSTISQPYTLAFMLQLLEVKDKQKILEIGSGCGYVLALLSVLAPHGSIIGVEIEKELVKRAQESLKGIKNTEVIAGNGFHGLPGKAPFERILLSAAAQETPRHLLMQLTEDGIIVSPVGTRMVQLKKKGKEVSEKSFYAFAFVPLRENA